MKLQIFIAVLCLSSVCLAQSVSTKGESLDKVQVLALLAGEVPNSRVASLVLERGILFEPSDRYIQLLQKAGADEGVITAVRLAHRSPTDTNAEAASAANGPLERDQILDLQQTGVDSGILAKLIATRGIDFEPFDEYLRAYEVAGAQASVLSALRQAGHLTSAPTTTTVALPKAQADRPTARGTTSKRLRVPGEIEAAKLTSRTQPEYPQIAVMARIQGMVRLQAIVGQDGTIQDLKVLSGPAMLLKSSVEAVSKWRYQPTVLKGKPVEVETEIDVNYALKM
ncbi:MAG: energy transducer TonB [Terriglobia bacterium]